MRAAVDLGDGLTSMPKAMQANDLKMNARSLSDVKVVPSCVSPFPDVS